MVRLSTTEHESILEFGSVTSLNDQLFGDFNGDRKSDKMYTYPLFDGSSWDKWYARYNSLDSYTETNTNNELQSPYINPNLTPNNSPQVVHYIGDVNGDGKSDVIEIENVQPSQWDPVQTTINVHYSNGVNFIKKSYPLSLEIDHKTDELTFGDFNGDGKLDIMVKQGFSFSKTFTVIYFEKESKERLLHGIKDGYNNTTEFTYDYLTNDAIYTKGNSSNYPVVDVQPSFPVVSSVKIPDGAGGDNITSYKYEEAKVHKKGKGYLGFKKLISENNVSGIKTTTLFTLNANYFINSPISINKELISGGQISLTTLEYTVSGLGNKRIFPFINKSITIDQLTNFTTTTDFIYDSFGNITNTNTTKGSLETVEITNTFGQHGSWIPSSLEQTSVEITRQGESSYTRNTEYIYNPQGKVIQKINDPGDAKELTTNFSYNILGNQISSTISGAGVTTRANFFVYDSKGRYIERTSNALNQYSYISYDHKWGVPLTVTGIDGLVTKYEYDGFGVLIAETTPDNIKTEYILGWDIGPGGTGSPTTVTNSIFTNTITKAGKPTVKKWFDAFGRERQKEVDGFNQKINQVTSYDERGNVKTTTSPFFIGGTSPIVTTNSYNNLNQIISSQNSAGTTGFSYAYSQNQVTTDVTSPDLTTSTKVVDATGKVVSSSDAGGSLIYAYFSSGLQKEVKLSGVSVSEMEYDLQGHQTKLDDKNAGVTEYGYNVFGELIVQKDANDNDYQINYDVLGRITSKTEINTAQSTDYTYRNSGNGINRIQKVIESTNNISEEYAYDNLNRVIQLKETIDGQAYNTDYDYDGFSNVISTTYPSGFNIEKTYNQFGYLDKVKNGTDVIWQAGDMNAYNQYTVSNQGNGLSTTKTYDAYGLPQQFSASNPNVQDLTFDFDVKNGNLLSREDPTKGLLEEFDYDNLNRLYQTQLNGVVQFTLNYSNNGNIDFKTDAGNYSYDNNKVNAVLTATNPNTDISLMQQDITYNIFNSPATIIEGINDLTLIYGPNEQRKKTIFTDGTNTTTKYFIGNYEKMVDGVSGDIIELHYIAGGDGLTAIYVLENGAGAMHYIYTDHLGSILTVTDEFGGVEAEQNFDAWGRERDPATWDYSGATMVGNIAGHEWLTRGYTGHEHLSNFGLINMNGRVYDPILARMLSPDNYVQSPLNTQSYNRYSYVINNPLKFVDPSGEFWNTVLQLGIYTAYNYFKGVFDSGGEWNPGNWNGTDANGEPVYQTFGVNIGGSGVNSYSIGFNSTSPTPNAIISANTIVSTPGINWALEDASKFEPKYKFPSMADINPDYYYETQSRLIKENNFEIDWSHSYGGYESNSLPVAIGLAIDGNGNAVAGLNGAIGYAQILQGPDRDQIVYFGDKAGGLGVDVSANLKVTYYFYTGNIDNFSKSNFDGWRNEFSLSATAFYMDFSYSYFKSESHDVHGGYLKGYSRGLGIGAIPIWFSGGWNLGHTTVFE